MKILHLLLRGIGLFIASIVLLEAGLTSLGAWPFVFPDSLDFFARRHPAVAWMGFWTLALLCGWFIAKFDFKRVGSRSIES